MAAHGRWQRWGSVILAIFSVSAAIAGAHDQPRGSAAPTCAFIDFDRSPLAAVLEAKLLADVEATWLERTAIDEVVKEQELQALFTPEGGAQRAALGKLLKADLLVMVRNAPPKPVEKSATSRKDEKPVEAIELAVTETRRGLRLISRAVPRSAEAEADADTLVELVREALAKHAQQVSEIYAVPPFVSRDLGYEHDYLRGAYARLLEQMLLERPGALVVELAEAQALAKEVALADPGSRIERDVPFYLLGEYRNDGAGAERRVRLSLKLMRGEQQLEDRSMEPIVPDDAAAVLRKLAGELVERTAGAKQAAVDPAAEIEALNRREKLFLRLGQWSDAVTLAEASLLLKPDQEPLRVDAILALTELCDQNWHVHPVDLDRLRLAVGYNRRGLQHLESFAANGGQPQKYDQRDFDFVWRLFSCMLNDDVNENYTTEHNQVIVELQRMRIESILPLIPKAARLGWKNDAMLLDGVLNQRSLEQQFDLVLRLIRQIKDLPGAKQRTLSYARRIRFRGLIFESRDRFEAFYNRLAEIDNAEVQDAAKQLKTAMAQMAGQFNRILVDSKAARVSESQRRATAKPAVALREVQFAWEDESGERGTFKSFGGCLPIGNDVDLVWNDSQLFLMRQPGRLKRVFPGVDGFGIEMLVANSGHARICYDGRFVWAALANYRGDPARVVVLDPVSEKCSELTTDDGMPMTAHALVGVNQKPSIAVAPLAPGKVCLAGYFGQTWLAIAEFDGVRFKPVKVFHEARDAWDRTSQRQFTDTHLAFQPTYMLKLRQSDGAGRGTARIVIGRGEVDGACPPLIIDPATLAVSTAPVGAQLNHQLPSSDTKNAVREDGIYSVRPPARGVKLAICRAELPRFVFQPVMQNVPGGYLVLSGDEVHIIGREWWTGRLGDSQLRRVAELLPWSFGRGFAGVSPQRGKELPEIRRVFRSSHYGILVQRARSLWYEETTFEARELLATAASPSTSGDDSKTATSQPSGERQNSAD